MSTPIPTPVRFDRAGTIGVITLDNPPVNAISAPVVAGLAAALDAFDAAPDLEALVVCCAGRTFVAGGDIAAFEDPGFSAAPFNAVLARLEANDRPVLAALHGTVLGGGLELALACHHRVALPGTRFGFPEVRIGLLPGSLGTQRLPRLTGLATALDLISSGRMIGAKDALAAGIVDAVASEASARDASGTASASGVASVRGTASVSGASGVRPGDDAAASVREAALAAARQLAAAKAPPRRGSALPAPALDEAVLARAAVDAAKKPGWPQLAAIVRCLRASTLPFAEGEAVEAAEFAALVPSPASKALRHLFFAEREAARIPGLPRDTVLRPVRRVGIVGAGTMGGGIAMNFANAGIPTVIVEVDDAALQRGLGLVRRNYEASAAKGRLTAAQVAQRMGLLTGALDHAALADCDLVIEAVFEDLALKQQVCARLGQVVKPGAIIATNTSTLDVNLLAQATGRPADVVGMHFFSPANVMRLLEVVRGDQTAPEVLATVMKLAQTIGKVAVVSGVCYGFIGNRMAEVYMREAEFLLMEGADPAQVDAAVQDPARVGLAMGPCRMLDMAGIDVGAKTVIEYGKAGGLPPDPSYRALVRELFAQGRHGQKTKAGYYRYDDGRTPSPDPALRAVADRLAATHGITRRSDIGADEIVERLLFPMINEGLKILQEGIAYRPGDIDVVWVAGYGFPDFRGGPMWMADAIGLKHVAARLAHYAATRGDPFGYWTPAPLLTRLAASGQALADWRP